MSTATGSDEDFRWRFVVRAKLEPLATKVVALVRAGAGLCQILRCHFCCECSEMIQAEGRVQLSYPVDLKAKSLKVRMSERWVWTLLFAWTESPGEFSRCCLGSGG